VNSFKFLPFIQNLDIAEEIELILSSTLEAVDPIHAVKKALIRDGNLLYVGGKKYTLGSYDRFFVIGAGKAAVHLAIGLTEVMGNYSLEGLIITKHLSDDVKQLPTNIRVLCGNHPVPGLQSLESAKALKEFTKGFTKKDLVFCVISGGGSSLMTHPVEGVTLGEIQELTNILLACGARIDEMNVLRKRLDQLKGGGLAKMVYPAELIALILSDVMGSPLDTIASGPTVPDPSTFHDALQVLEKYKIRDRIPKSILQHLDKGVNKQQEETKKPGDQVFSSVTNIIVADNRIACEAAREKAKALGYNSLILTTFLKGEARNTGEYLASILRESTFSDNPIRRPFCIICGGETTVTIKGKGVGGRNQEVALGSVPELAGLERVSLITFATDGEDGPTDAAGAVVTGDTLHQAISRDISIVDCLAENDSYRFFKSLGSLLVIGPTGTNVNDINFLFAW
jgi:glycerate 2-kinase